MPQLNDDAKPALLNERLAVKNQRTTWTALTGAMTFGATHVPPIFILPATLCAIMGIVAARQIHALERALDDPPRDDYLVPTRKGFRHFNPTALGTSPLAISTANAARETLEVSSLLDAAVRAEERALGARNANEPLAEERRSVEAKRLLLRAARSHGHLADAMSSLAEQWDSWGRSALSISRPRPLPDDQEVTIDGIAPLPDDARQLLKETGLSIDDVNTSITVPAEAIQRPLSFIASRIPRQSTEIAESASRIAALPESAISVNRPARDAVRANKPPRMSVPPPIVQPGRVTIFEKIDGGFAFRLTSTDGQIFATSIGHATRSAARLAAQAFIENAPKAEIITRSI